MAYTITILANDITVDMSGVGPQGPAGGSGITPNAAGTLAGRSAHNAEVAGFVYLATDQVPAAYYLREGAAGGWSAGITLRGMLGDTDSYQFIFDEVDAATTYIGKASLTALLSDPAWSIAKYTMSGNSGNVKFAVGSASRSAIWNNRTSSTYI